MPTGRRRVAYVCAVAYSREATPPPRRRTRRRLADLAVALAVRVARPLAAESDGARANTAQRHCRAAERVHELAARLSQDRGPVSVMDGHS